MVIAIVKSNATVVFFIKPPSNLSDNIIKKILGKKYFVKLLYKPLFFYR